MAVPRKAMTEGIRTAVFPGILNSRNFTIPQSKIKDFCQLPLHKGASGCSRTSALYDGSQTLEEDHSAILNGLPTTAKTCAA